MAETMEGERSQPPRQAFLYHILRYVPDLVRDEWVNIGVLIFNPGTGERRLRMIEDADEYNRVRRLHPRADEALLRAMRDDLENRLESAMHIAGPEIPWQGLLGKWQETLSNALQIAPQKGVLADDLDAELERLYIDHVAVPRRGTRLGLPGGRAAIRAYCAQVFRQARIWDRIAKSVRVAEFTFPDDPSRLDYSYHRNGTRGFVHTLSVSRAPQDAKTLSYNVRHIADNERHRFVMDTLREVGVESVPVEGLAVWVAKLRPSLLQ